MNSSVNEMLHRRLQVDCKRYRRVQRGQDFIPLSSTRLSLTGYHGSWRMIPGNSWVPETFDLISRLWKPL